MIPSRALLFPGTVLLAPACSATAGVGSYFNFCSAGLREGICAAGTASDADTEGGFT